MQAPQSDPFAPGPDESAPHDPAALRALAQACRERGDELGAVAHGIAAQTLEAPAGARPLADLATVATGYFMKGDHARAGWWYRLLLALDPGQAAAWQNLAAIHDGRAETEAARRCRERAYGLQRVFVEPVPDPSRRLLVLCAGSAAGNVPFETLLAGGRSLRIKYAIDFADEREDAALPPYDLVFNAIGDADVAAPLQARLERFAADCARPLLNAPATVARTRRDRLPALLQGIAGVDSARCCRHETVPATRAELERRLAEAGIALPLLVRPAASHGGIGLRRCERLDELVQALETIAGAHYLSEFRDSRAGDGRWRKARMVFVDREPLPYHLAISDDWMVHYFSSAMLADGWKIEEERRFLADPTGVLGAEAMAALRAIGRRLDLDYAGVDFTLQPDGRVLVFEANATMLVHRERRDGPLAHKNAAVQAIVEAFERRLTGVAADCAEAQIRPASQS